MNATQSRDSLVAVTMMLNVLDAAMDALTGQDRSRVARAFVHKYGSKISDDDAPTLTATQWRVLRALADGYSTQQCVFRLGMAYRTISFHIEQITRKLNANNRTHAVAEAFRRGML